MSPTIDSLGERRGATVVVLIYAMSHALYAWLGVRFDASTFPGYMQFLDTDLLSNRLFESLWYYHANPPMLNLLAGVGLKLFGNDADWFFSIVFHVFGVGMAFAVYALTRQLSGSTIAAGVATAALVFSPAFVLYENWFMYSFPAAALLTLSALFLYRYAQTGHFGWSIAFFGTLGLLLLTRSLFHLGWLMLIVLSLTVIYWDRRKQILLSSAVPILLVVLWYAKNDYLFGTFSSSTWFGLGFSNISTLVVSREELEPLVERRELSKYALMSRYQQVDELFSSPTDLTGIPALDQVRKSTGSYNYNNNRIVSVSRYYAADAAEVVRKFPASYAVGLVISNRLFFSPSSMNLYFAEANREAARPMEKLFNPVLYGVGAQPKSVQQPHFGFTSQYSLEVNTSIALFFTWWLLLGYGYVRGREAFLTKDPNVRPQAVVIGFIVFTALYIYVVGTAFELAENYRYRWLIEPLFLVLAISAAVHLFRTSRTRWSRKRPGLT